MDTIAAYSLELEQLEAALSDGKGVRIPFLKYEDAVQHRHRLHRARRKDRSENIDLANEHPLYGKSVYDQLRLRIKAIDDKWWVYIEHATGGEMESLSDVSDEGPNESDHPAVAREPEPRAEVIGQAIPIVRRRITL